MMMMVMTTIVIRLLAKSSALHSVRASPIRFRWREILIIFRSSRQGLSGDEENGGRKEGQLDYSQKRG